MKTGAEGGKRWTRRREARPGELVTAALALFSERGFAATRLEDVAVRAGVTKATVYLYFESKERLFEAVVREAAGTRLDQAGALITAFSGTTPDLVRTLIGMFEHVLDGPLPAVAKMIVAESGNFPALARMWTDLVVRRGLEMVASALQRGVDRGEFRAMDTAAVAPLVVAPVFFLGLWSQSLGRHSEVVIDRRAMLAAHAETLLRGLAAHPGAVAQTEGQP